MTLYLSEEDIGQVVGMKDAIASLDRVFTAWGTPGTNNQPRRRMPLPKGLVNLMAASDPDGGYFGTRTYPIMGGMTHNLLLLYSMADGKPAAILEWRRFSTMRTGAASGLASRYMARENASRVGMIGTGRQAKAQLRAVCAVRPVTEALVFSRDQAKRETFAEEMARELGISVKGAATGEECVGDADIVITITNSAEPVINGNWLKAGTHVNGAGSNAGTRRELDDQTVLRADIMCIDHREQGMTEAGELIALTKAGKIAWDAIPELGDVVQGKVKGRESDDQITLFRSLGIALEDVAFGGLALERARAKGLGREMGDI